MVFPHRAWPPRGWAFSPARSAPRSRRRSAAPGQEQRLLSVLGLRMVREGDVLVVDVGDDLQPAAERGYVGGERADFDGAWFGALNGRDAFLPDVHALCYLRLSQFA